MDLGEFQSTIRHLASQQPSTDSEADEEPHMQAETYQVHCRLCSTYLCELSDIRRYMKSYHLVLNPNIHEKVDLKSLNNSFMKFFDGKFCEGFLICDLFSFILIVQGPSKIMFHCALLPANSLCTLLSCKIYNSHASYVCLSSCSVCDLNL